jgi:hypothetical protein
MEKSNKKTIFDYFKNICKKTGKLEKSEINSSFDSVGMLRLMSYDRPNVLIANAINSLTLDKWTVYLYYYYGCNERTFVPFLNMKKVKDEEMIRIEELARLIFPEYSDNKIKDVVIPILKNELLNFDINKLNTGGIKKEEK